MTTEPDQLRREIEQTQRGLSADVDALTEKVTPSKIVHRRMDRARRTMDSMRDAVMGTASDATDRVGSTASSAVDEVTSAASTAGQAISDAPKAVRRQTQGNPLAAGLIAFGAGWLTASLLPPSKREQQLAEQAKDLAQEHVPPMVGDAAEQLKENLREPVEQAVESVKSTAEEAGSTVAKHAQSAVDDVKNEAQQATGQHSDSTPAR
jgi:ElaB/YqjD/DUF883 family membrane-anchored ribosome-binding protein